MADGKVVIETELDSSKAEKSAKKLGGSLKSELSSGIGFAVKGIATVGATATVAGGAMVKLAKDTADAGDHIDKMSQKLGISAEAYQKWDYVAQISGTSIDSLKMGFKTLTTQMSSAQDGTEKSIAYFEKLNISVDDLKNLSREEIFEKTIKGLQNVADETERTSLANKLLGRSAMELGPLLNASNEDVDNLMQTAEDYGMIMSDDAVKASADFTDAVTTMTKSLAGFRARIVSGVMPELTELFNGLSLIFKGDTKEGFEKISQVVDKLVKRLKSSVSTLITEIPKKLKTMIEQIAKMLPEVIKSVSGGLQDLLGGFSLSGEIGGISEMGSSIMQDIADGITNSLPIVISTLGNLLISIMTKLNEILPQVYSMALEILPNMLGALLDTLPSIIEQIPPIFSQIAEQLVQSISDFVVYSFQLMQGYLEEVVQHLPDIINSLVNAIPDMIGSLLSAIISHAPDVALAGLDLLGSLFVNLPDILGSLLKGVIDLVAGLVAMLYDQLPVIAEAGIEFFMGLVERGPDILSGIGKFVTDLVSNILGVLGALVSGIATIGSSMVSGLVGALSTAWDNLSSTVGEWVSDVIDAIVGFFTGYWESVTDIGTNIVEGIWDGISGAGDWLLDQISGFADGIVDGIAGFFGIASPSKVMRDEIGKYLAEGIWVGFEENDPMEQINKDLKYGMKGIENSMTVSGGYYAGINYEKLGDAVAQGFIDADVEWTVDNRQFARLERGYA